MGYSRGPLSFALATKFRFVPQKGDKDVEKELSCL
jgi:hypothetical protein